MTSDTVAIESIHNQYSGVGEDNQQIRALIFSTTSRSVGVDIYCLQHPPPPNKQLLSYLVIVDCDRT